MRHCQTAPLYRPKKPAQFGKMAQFGRWTAYLRIILEIATHTLNMAQDILFVAKNFCKKWS